jgi:hypothetical protein
MNPLEAEALEYPSAHRDRARELLTRRAALTAALASLPSGEISQKADRRARIIAFAVIPLALLTTIGSMTELFPKQPATIFSLILIVCSLTVFIVIARAEQKRLRRDRLESAQRMVLRELDEIRNDYTTTEGERTNSDVAVAVTLEPHPRETSNRVVLVAATIGLIGIVGVLVFECVEAFIQ